MAAQLNHTIVWSSDQMKSATFLAEMLGRPAPTRVAHFDVVELDNGVSLDFANADGPIRQQAGQTCCCVEEISGFWPKSNHGATS
jgi:hypothetical protein